MTLRQLKQRSLIVYPGMCVYDQRTRKVSNINLTPEQIRRWDHQYCYNNSRFAFSVDGMFYVTPAKDYSDLIAVVEELGFKKNEDMYVPFSGGAFVYPAEPEDNACWKHLMYAFSYAAPTSIDEMVCYENA